MHESNSAIGLRLSICGEACFTGAQAPRSSEAQPPNNGGKAAAILGPGIGKAELFRK